MQNNTITLQLDVFEGPLDLLLYLIKKNDLEISRISIAQITDQYLIYLDSLKELDIDAASEFLFMAAELAYIKSKTLLPHQDDEDGEEDEVANDLVARLKEFERYKMAAEDLKKRPWLHRDVFVRGSFIHDASDDDEDDKEKEKKVSESGEEYYEVDTYELTKAFYEILNKFPQEQVNHQVVAERISVTDRIYEVLDHLRNTESVLFTDLFVGDRTRADVVITFLALLEMAKLKMIRIYQTGTFDPIRLQRKIEVGSDILNNEGLLDNLEDYK